MNCISLLQIAVVIPCHNEALTIANVVKDFQKVFPQGKIHVFDNNSTDDSAELARAAGADVRSVALQGKGNVVRRMFADIDADIYIMVDGDDTYDAGIAPQLVKKLCVEHLDMVVGCRVAAAAEAYRFGHAFGNRIFNSFLALLFDRPCRDIFSGYRVFSRRFAKSFPAQSSGFEIETELTVHALELKMPIGECDTIYKQRPEGSSSKLSTYRDGWRILKTMIKLFRIERPLTFFGLISGLLIAISILLDIPLLITYIETGLVPRLPTAVLSTSLMLLGALSLFCGLVLENVTYGRREARMIAYLAIPATTHILDKARERTINTDVVQ